MNRMKVCAVAVMTLAAGTARAGWVTVAEDGASATFGDPATVERKGDTATLHALVNLSVPRRLVEVSYQSQKQHMEFRCAAREARVLAVSLHAGTMGEGKVVYEDPSPKDWSAIEASSPMEKLHAMACR